MTTSSLSSRISESAAGLAKDLFSTHLNQNAAIDATNDLAALKSTHKPSSPTHNGTPSPRIPKVPSNRQRGTIDSMRNSRASANLLYSESAFGDEISGYLWDNFKVGESSASSSRSGSTLDMELENEVGLSRWHREFLIQQNGSPDFVSSRSQQSACVSGNTRSKSPVSETLDVEESSGIGGQPFKDGSLVEDVRDSHQASTESKQIEMAKEIAQPNISPPQHRALDRLQLITTHINRLSQVEPPKILNQAPKSESTYNQLCCGEESQEWALFEYSIMHRSQQALDQRHAQTQQAEQAIIATETQRQNPPTHSSARQSNRTQQPHHLRTHIHHQHHQQQQRHPTEKEPKQQKEKEPMPSFHCPWVDCHRRFQVYTDHHMRDSAHHSENMSLLLSCVHAGCELHFDDEDGWRDHVFSTTHHDLLPAVRHVSRDVDMDGAWEKVQS